MLSSVAVSPTTGAVGDTLTCSATATDADGGTPTITYVWSDGSTGSTYLLTTSDTPGDTVTCTATATDADSGADSGAVSDTATVTVDNTAPTEPVVSIGPADAAEGEALSCSIDTPSSDADGDSISYDYAWYEDSAELTASAGSSTLSGSYVLYGFGYTCEVTASDGTNTATGVSDTLEPCELLTWYPDSDDDGYGTSGTTAEACEQPSGYAATSDDCDDDDDTFGAISADADCDGALTADDCDDLDATVQVERYVIECLSSDKITVAASSLLEFGGADSFTIDYWAYLTSSSQGTLVKGNNSTKEYAVAGGSTTVS